MTVTDGFEHFAVLFLEEVVHLLFRETGEFQLIGIAGGGFPQASSLYKNGAMQGVGVGVGFTLHVVDGVAVFYVGIKAEDH